MTTLHVHPHFNHEEAAHAAAEYLASLDNLQAEIQFLTDEIKEKDIRITSLLQRINSRHTGLTRQLKNPTASTATFPLPIPPGAPLPTEHLSAKDATALTKIQAEWGKIDALQDEKVALAERMERIVNRAKERGKAEWLRVGGMDLDLLENEAANGKPGGLGEMGNGDIMLPPGGLGSGSDMRPQKKRKLQTLPLPLPTSALPAGMVVHPPNSMGPPSAPLRPQLSARHSTAHRSGRHERHTSGLSDLDMDAHGEAEETEPADGEADDTLYCFCRQKSYGEMIGCDNDKCEFEWFHVKCVNLNAPLPETWYCPDCVSKLGLASSDGTRLNQKDKKNRRR